MACDPRYLSPCKFAIAVKSGIRKYQVDVYQISRGWDSELKLIGQYPMQEEIKVKESLIYSMFELDSCCFV